MKELLKTKGEAPIDPEIPILPLKHRERCL